MLLCYVMSKNKNTNIKWINNSRPVEKKRVPRKIFVDKIWHTLANRIRFAFQIPRSKKVTNINVRLEITVDSEQMVWWISVVYESNNAR